VQEVLLIRDARSRKWGFPKGHREPEDASDLHTAVRECREETGLEASAYTVVEPSFRLTRGSASYLFRYAILKATEPEPLTIRPGEIEAYAWVPVASLLSATTPYRETGNKYLRTWILDLKNEDNEVRRKSMVLYTALVRSLQEPATESVRSSHVVARS
jgi:8-oxo-dGTP pyrophosphatase MutT (NUDIX family)